MNLDHNTLKLLYVEDNEQARKSTQIILQEYFNHILVAVDGEDGFNKFKNNAVDLIITDINMPKLNGIEMIQKIRSINKEVPILVISAYSDTHYFTDSIKHGVQGYILKPLNIHQLEEAINTIKVKIVKNHQRKNSTRLLRQYQEIADKSTIISKTDLNGMITYVNDEFCRTSGYTREELIGQSHNIVRSPDEPAIIFKKLWETIKEKKETWHGVIKNQSKNGDIYYVKTTIKPILDYKDDIEEFIALRTLITDIIHPKKQLMDLLASLDESIVVLIKIEDFNYIETPLEKEESNKLQKEFAKKIFTWIPKKCRFSKVYLLEEGEFVFAKKYVHTLQVNELIKDIQYFQQQINATKINISPIDYDLSIIISLGYGKNAFENAQIGLTDLLETKQDFIIANELLNTKKSEALETIETFKMVKKAIDSYNIVSYFQPIVNNKTQQIEKYESLVRLIDEEKNIISPHFFLNTAKEGKYYKQITSMVLKNSFNALVKTNMNISINLSALDIEKIETKEIFFNLLEQHKEQAHKLTLELLEDEAIKNVNTIKEFIKQVRSYGVSIAIDDFGTGYSNFTRLLEYQPDYIKIDGSLILNIEHDNFSKNMVETIVAFAKKQGIKTIAEYVESEGIFNILCELGVDASQGYYFGKPTQLES
ncbi:EAL domain-containing protein [bacterium]|nr:EAL domain-containing protein [bacterium]MBU1957885.1 EAL domain-containing protein [bacterium]